MLHVALQAATVYLQSKSVVVSALEDDGASQVSAESFMGFERFKPVPDKAAARMPVNAPSSWAPTI